LTYGKSSNFIERASREKKVLIPLILILLLGAVLRFYGLGNESFWIDELATWGFSGVEDFGEVLNRTRCCDTNPPLYYLIIHFVIKYLGVSESIIRFPSAVSGVLSIFVIFLLGLCLYSYREGLIAATLMAVLTSPIYYSQEARSYCMLLLFSMSATYFWIKILWSFNEKSRPSYYTILGYITTAVVSSYLHHYGLYLIGLQGLFAFLFFIRTGHSLLNVILIYVPILLSYLPWLSSALEQTKGTHFIRWIPSTQLIPFIKDYVRFLYNDSRIIGLFALAMYFFLFLRSVYDILKTKKYKNAKNFFLSPDLLLLLWLVAPFVGMYVISILYTPFLTPRYLIISLPAAYLLLSRSITQLLDHARLQTIITVAITVLLLFHLIFFRNFYSQPHKQQFREAVGYIVEHDRLYNDSLITGSPAVMDYYFKRKGSDRRIELEIYKHFAQVDTQKLDIAEASKLISVRNPRYIWYICGHTFCPYGEYIDFLNKNFTLVDHRGFWGTEVWLFKKRNDLF